MPGWGAKDECMYEHIKKSAQARGGGMKRAKEIAARTVNKQRREDGRTPNKQTEGTGNPNVALEDRSVRELKNLASGRKLRGRSRMNKQQLVSALKNA